MNTPIPDNEINKELKARLNNIDVAGENFKLFVSRVTSQRASNYFLVTTQLNQPERTKCGRGWRNSTEIQVTVILSSNKGSKRLLNSATERLRQGLDDFTLPSGSGLVVNYVELFVENELVETSGANTVYRKIVRMETVIN